MSKVRRFTVRLLDEYKHLFTHRAAYVAVTFFLAAVILAWLYFLEI